MSLFQYFFNFFNFFNHDVNIFLFEAKEDIGLMRGW